jgi:hypothetical protein
MTPDERLDRLTRRLRRWQWVWALTVLLTAVGFAFLMLRPPPAHLQAQNFEVVNTEGNVVAILGTTSRHGFLDVSTGDGVPIFNVIAHPGIADMGMFSLRNVRGREIVNVRTDQSGSGILSVRDTRGLERVLLLGANATATGGTVLVMNAERQPNVVASMQADGYGHGEVQACPSNGEHCRKLIPSQ